MKLFRPENTYSKKYRSLILSLIALSLLVASVMALSLYISKQLEKQSQIINTAFEQTSLINQIVSDLHIIHSQYNQGKASSFTLESLEDKVTLIDQRMSAFLMGGDLPIVSNDNRTQENTIAIPPFKDPALVDKVKNIHQLWMEYKRRITPVFNLSKNAVNELFSRYQFYGAVLYKQGAIQGLQRLHLHTQMDSFALELQSSSDQQAELLRLIQIVGIIITFISLGGIVFFVIRQLRHSDQVLENAQEEAKGILNTIQEGLFLIHEDKTIGSEYSSKLESIFETDNISGNNIKDLLGSFISEKEYKNLDSFIKALFNPKVVENLLGDLNPLKSIKVNLSDESGKPRVKHLSFNFYRVIKRGKISDILVSTSDITNTIVLQQTLDKTKTNNERQIKDLLTIIKADSQSLQQFLSYSLKSTKKINQVLKNQANDPIDAKAILTPIIEDIHSIKGDASALGLYPISEKAHHFENEISKLFLEDQLVGSQFIPTAVHLEELMTHLENLQQLNQKLKKADVQIDKGHSQWQHITDLTKDLSQTYGKKVSLVTSGLHEVSFDEKHRASINSIIIHLLKNSVVHGIESPSERLALGKHSHGRIDIRVSQLPQQQTEIIIRDDGRGLDTRSITKKALEKGLISEQEAISLSPNQVHQLIFHPGFSTAEIDIHAGRGVGLSAVGRLIKSLEGSLRIQQKEGKFCQFAIVLPTKTTNS